MTLSTRHGRHVINQAPLIIEPREEDLCDAIIFGDDERIIERGDKAYLVRSAFGKDIVIAEVKKEGLQK